MDIPDFDSIFGGDEMSPYFLASGKQLTWDEYRAHKFEKRVQQEERRLAKCQKSLFWLGYALKLPRSFDLKGMILKTCVEGASSFYHAPQVIAKEDGSPRIIISPKPDLMRVQRGINRLLLRTFTRHPNTFGYMGGSCREVAERHVNWESTLKFDVRDAFFKITAPKLRAAILRHHVGNTRVGFSAPVAYWISRLCTYWPAPEYIKREFGCDTSFLPQGAPTSPACFHLACRGVDRKLDRIAARVGGIVSRYADNYYFSVHKPRFPHGLEKILICETEHRGFPIHKIRRVNEGELCKILGYNLQGGRITNTRGYRRKLRGALHVLKTKLERGLEYDEAYARVRGLMGFTVNLPQELQAAYDHCESLVEG